MKWIDAKAAQPFIGAFIAFRTQHTSYGRKYFEWHMGSYSPRDCYMAPWPQCHVIYLPEQVTHWLPLPELPT